MKTATIVGAGLAGSLWAVYLAKAGYNVTIFERRSDIRLAEIQAGKSINLALSHRGWEALRAVGVDHHVNELAIPMTGRIMHSATGELTAQPYGQEGQAIYSVSRGGLNAKMMDVAEKEFGATINYNMQCTGGNLEEGIVYLTNKLTGEHSEHQSDLVFGCDGAYSALRYKAFQKLDRFNYSQEFVEDGYKEFLIPANADGSYKLDKNALHIWPRGRFMLIALANEDGSFTCTLFMPFEGDENAFDKINTKAEIEAFFETRFPDFYEMCPNVVEQWGTHPLSSLAIMRCYPWTSGKAALMGDAAHATVPFYGQGMNASLEDCHTMGKLMEEHDHDWEAIFKAYQADRKPNGDAVQELSKHNYLVMRDFVADPQFLLQKKFENRIQELYPEKYIALYSMVSFSSIPYAEAWKKGQEQDVYMKDLMQQHDIESLMKEGKVDDLIHRIFKDKLVSN
ncbi:kynurenine 3-monooxygenase [Putridiphycobacter roseus]|uniref:Kynurenine 3-monooxygenase n=1 Tax=Putridiphycobacter roseus TaxID=2219161 RepID=A0A2W1NTA5_9FLAO|nr:NAD(P)/FAD-dependent oxidoreductase [Putridiphycobacter roseus]PZE18882.1 kynurenine 3-monooxygenase [Putridiphycobacter roseus]